MAQPNISFQSYSFEEATKRARLEDKLIFIDTYAAWCAPCKIQDEVFENAALAHFFNKHMVNIKIDMDGPLGHQIKKRFAVVWLPTLIISDHNGRVLTKIDELISAEELLTLAKEAIAGKARSHEQELNKTPFYSKASSERKPESAQSRNEEVLYIHDSRVSSGRPSIMFHEAYLHLQLMDGRHQEVVQRYLSTQDDWSTEKNIKFIFDFVQDTQSKLFRYLVENKNRFVEVLGKEKVDQSINILVRQRLDRGFPRPDEKEVRSLRALLN